MAVQVYRYDDSAEQELAWLMRQNRKASEAVGADSVRGVVQRLQALVPSYLREVQEMARELNRLVALHNECEAVRDERKAENTKAIETSLRGMTLLFDKVTAQAEVLARRDREYAHVEAISLEQEGAFTAISEVVANATRPQQQQQQQQWRAAPRRQQQRQRGNEN